MLCWKEIEYRPTVRGKFRPFETHSLTTANIELFVENLTPMWQGGTSDATTDALKRWVLHNVSLTHKRSSFSIHVQLFYITWSILILQIAASAYCVKCQRSFVHSAILMPTENQTLGLKPMFEDTTHFLIHQRSFWLFQSSQRLFPTSFCTKLCVCSAEWKNKVAGNDHCLIRFDRTHKHTVLIVIMVAKTRLQI